MSYQAVDAVMRRSRATGSERLLLMVIATHADAESLTAFLGETLLGKEANMKERNLRYTLAKLKASGELQCAVGGGRGHANVYKLTLPLESDKGAVDCPVSIRESGTETLQYIVPLSDERGQSVAGFVEGKGGNPPSERGQSVVEKGQPIAPQPEEPENEPKAVCIRPRGASELLPEREADIRALHTHYCGSVGIVPLDLPAWQTLNRALGEKGLAFCREVVDGCAMDEWEGRKFNDSVTFIFGRPDRMERLAKIARQKKGNLSNGTRTEPQRNGKASRADTYHSYDYSGFDGPEGEGAREPDSEVPPDEWVATPTPRRPDGNDRRMVRSSRH